MKFIDQIVLIFIIISVNTVFFFYYLKISKVLNLYDLPNSSLKKHKSKAYPLGGIILYLNVLIIFLLDLLIFDENIFNLNESNLIYFFLSLSGIFFLGFIDDKINLNYKKKILILTFIIILLLLNDSSLQIKNVKLLLVNKNFVIDSYAIVFTTFFILLFMNAFNMFDGVNLQAGIYTLTTLIFFYFGIFKIFLFILIIFFLIFFLYFNEKKNVFLGNSGSLLISFLISYYFIKQYNLGNINYAESIYIFMCIPGLDMFRLFIERLVKKKNPFKGDNFHLHHLSVNKLGFLKSTFLIQSLISVAIMISLFFSIKLAIFLSLTAYILIIFFFKKK
jgi:UDP-GlcNAc:undecaprenyl-phosphate/decaprenyl-phosphate GlcNAc-1-phosphate transferase